MNSRTAHFLLQQTVRSFSRSTVQSTFSKTFRKICVNHNAPVWRQIQTSSLSQVPRWRTAITTLRGDNHKVDVDEAKHFVFLLEPEERELILKELTLFQEDPGDPLPPNTAQLKKLAVYCALPFIGFGFLDNFLMIVAGAYIEIGIGTVFTISTMAAAALGNTVSDIAGVGSASYIEHWTSKLGIVPPNLTPKQTDMRRTRWAMSLGRGVGVTIGCLLGMFPLLFYNFDSADDGKKLLVEVETS